MGIRRRLTAMLALGCALALGAAPARAATPPAIGATWAIEVAATSARLRAEINPGGSETTYHFNYITEAAYQANLSASREAFSGAAKAPAGTDPGIGSGTTFKTIQQSVGGLPPETTYRYRVVARNSGGTMVSPIETNGGAVEGPGQTFGGGVLQAAASGEAVTYSSLASFGEPSQGPAAASQYLSRRSSGGWPTENITTPAPAGSYGDQPEGVPYQLFSLDLARGLLLNGRRCAAGEECPRSYSLHESETGVFTATPAVVGLHFEGSSPDLHHLVFSAQDGLYEWSGGALEAISEVPGARLAAQSGAVSENGSRVYFTTPEDSPILLREGGTTKSLPETVGGGGAFEAASADGAFAFFAKGGTLYRYSLAGEASEPIASEVEGVLGASADGSHVYYATAAGIYLWDAGTSTLVASSTGGQPAAQAGDYPPTTGTARVSSDGAHLAFLSTASLTGYDNTDQVTGEPDSEVYLWDAGSREFTCASCNPTGERPLGASSIPGAVANGTGPGATDSYKPRALSGDGRRLFFDTRDALVLQDTDNAPDAYEWEAQGEGSCGKPGGCVALISSGRSAEGASFVDASESGHDAFFLTDGSLVPSDPGSVDLYDAREGGGFPAGERPIECDGDACQPLLPEPEDPNPGTLLPSAGNPPLEINKPPACRKGFVRKHGRCVRQRRKGRHHRRHR
jgi:hypothetical protein